MMYPDGKVKVYIETPDETGGFHDAICWLPDYTSVSYTHLTLPTKA